MELYSYFNRSSTMVTGGRRATASCGPRVKVVTLTKRRGATVGVVPKRGSRLLDSGLRGRLPLVGGRGRETRGGTERTRGNVILFLRTTLRKEGVSPSKTRKSPGPVTSVEGPLHPCKDSTQGRGEGEDRDPDTRPVTVS